MEIERKVSGSSGRFGGSLAPKPRRGGTLRRADSDRRRAAAQARKARGAPNESGSGAVDLTSGIVGSCCGITLGSSTSPYALLAGTRIKVASPLDLRRKMLTSVGSQYLERIRTARSSYMESARGFNPQPSLADLQVCQGGAELGQLVNANLLGMHCTQIVGRQVSVKSTPKAKKAPKPSKAELDEMTDNLVTRALEVEAILRRDFTSHHAALEDTRKALKAALQFISDLHKLAEESDHLAGAIFQELLARHAAAAAAAAAEASSASQEADGAGAGGGACGPGRGTLHIGRARAAGNVPLETLTDLLTIDSMMAAAHEVCGLIRVKIEDNNDLGLATTVLEDCSGFFDSVEELANWREMDVMTLIEELRAF